MRLFDTATGTVRPLEAAQAVSMYTCGVTPYDATHLGHVATFSVVDVLRRRLEDLGHDVRCVRNVTDVDDAILARARQDGVHHLDLAAAGMARLDADLTALGLAPPTAEPRATSAISEIRNVIGRLLASGHAYRAQGHVYLDARRCADLGGLAGLDEGEMIARGLEHGERLRSVGRRHPLDTVLWQPAAPDEPSWDARWGTGRPGWHVECTALALSTLGSHIDVHAGGRDLVHPHHTYEAAQAEAVTGERFVGHWLHVGLVRHRGEKMAKSAGNLVLVEDLLTEWSPAAVRVAIADRPYRHDAEWTYDLPAGATERLERWRRGHRPHPGPLAEVRAALDDDLDVPRAFAALDDAAALGHDVTAALALVGVPARSVVAGG